VRGRVGRCEMAHVGKRPSEGHYCLSGCASAEVHTRQREIRETNDFIFRHDQMLVQPQGGVGGNRSRIRPAEQNDEDETHTARDCLNEKLGIWS